MRTGLLARTLVARGHDVLWWAAAFDHYQKRTVLPPGARIELQPRLVLRALKGVGYRSNVSLRRLVNHVELARHFASLAPTESQPDVVLASLPPVELAWAAVDYATSARVPVAVDVRDLWPDVLVDVVPAPLRGLARVSLWWMGRATRRALRAADAVLAVSPSYLAWALRHAGRPQGPLDAVIPLGYPRAGSSDDLALGAGPALRVLGVDPGKRIVWFVGAFGRSYDLNTVLRSASQLHDMGRADVQFVLSGDGDQDTRLRREAARLPNVVFTGWVNPAQIGYLMGVAAIGLAAYTPGALQSLPNKLFEYMRGGLPILSSLTGDGAAFIEGHGCGLTYRAGDARELARLVLELVDDEPLRSRLAAAGRAAFNAGYTAEAVYERMADCLTGLARSGNGGHAASA
jgi:glycosyltransferase involved in cell wall biosynthesis